MKFIDLAVQIFSQVTKTEKGREEIASALLGLLSSKGGDLDIMGIVSQFQSVGVQSAVSSWLGNGENEGLDIQQILCVLGQSNVSSFANKLDLSEGEALSGLGDMIPKLIDQSSSGGSLLDSVGGIDGALKMAKGLF